MRTAASKLDEILRLRRDAKPMELYVIAEALRVPPPFLSAELDSDRHDGRRDQSQLLAEALDTIKLLADRLRSER